MHDPGIHRKQTRYTPHYTQKLGEFFGSIFRLSLFQNKFQDSNPIELKRYFIYTISEYELLHEKLSQFNWLPTEINDSVDNVYQNLKDSF